MYRYIYIVVVGKYNYEKPYTDQSVNLIFSSKLLFVFLIKTITEQIN